MDHRGALSTRPHSTTSPALPGHLQPLARPSNPITSAGKRLHWSAGENLKVESTGRAPAPFQNSPPSGRRKNTNYCPPSFNARSLNNASASVCPGPGRSRRQVAGTTRILPSARPHFLRGVYRRGVFRFLRLTRAVRYVSERGIATKPVLPCSTRLCPVCVELRPFWVLWLLAWLRTNPAMGELRSAGELLRIRLYRQSGYPAVARERKRLFNRRGRVFRGFWRLFAWSAIRQSWTRLTVISCTVMQSASLRHVEDQAALLFSTRLILPR